MSIPHVVQHSKMSPLDDHLQIDHDITHEPQQRIVKFQPHQPTQKEMIITFQKNDRIRLNYLELIRMIKLIRMNHFQQGNFDLKKGTKHYFEFNKTYILSMNV